MISCVMLTRGQLWPALWALENFLAQTWPQKELIIVAEHDSTELQAWLQLRPDARVRYVCAPVPAMRVGARRNFGISLAQGDYIATWDEDGRHDPQRLAASLEALKEVNAQAVFLGKLHLWRPHLARITQLGSQPWPNTMVAHKHVLPDFPELERGEDAWMCQTLIAQTKAILLDRPDLYVAVDTGGDPAQQSHLDQLEQRHGLLSFDGLDYLDKFTALNVRVGLIQEAAKLSHVAQLAQRRRVNCLVEQQPGQGVTQLTLDVNRLKSPPEAMQPLVSCLMVTRGHEMPAKFAVACFQRQTWSNRELVVVVDANSNNVTQWLYDLQDPRIRVHVQAPGLTLGALRNQSVALATGDFVIQWDDDDLSDPDRISACMGVLQHCRVNAVLLQRWLQWWPARSSLIASLRRPWEGSMLARKSCMSLYPELSKGEDTDVMSQVLVNHGGALIDWPELYVYTVTGRNTWDEAHFEAHWAKSTWTAEGNQYQDALHTLSARMPFTAYAKALSEVDLDHILSNASAPQLD